ncbi:MAG: aspartate/glutamate racemase family protein [candidate division Zixibacteria bacterium]|nr:aspartate/glutamate racemase family protein [candidate division Zixibacteria bacterium]
MKTIGLIGGMTWRSTVEYYRVINETVDKRLGSSHSARCLIYSVEFGEVNKLQHQGRWLELDDIMIDAAVRLEKAGAELILICANTMHKSADRVQAAVKIPLLHIADETAATIKSENLNKVGLLGTKFTMEEDFYKGRLKDKFDIEVLIPDKQDRQIVHDVIYDELGAGVINDDSRQLYIKIIKLLTERGAEGIVLGCTEIPLLISRNNCPVPVFDTTLIHAEAAVNFALA